MKPHKSLLSAAMLFALAGCTLTDSEPVAASYIFIEGSQHRGTHGLHGITESADGALYVGSVLGQTIFRIDPETGALTPFVTPAEGGSADDLVFAKDGTLYWTNTLIGKVLKRSPDGTVETIAENLPGANSIDLHPDGRLFVTQVFQADVLLEIDPSGEAEPRIISTNMGGLNGFEIGADGFLYGPLWFRNQIVRVDVDTGELTVIAEGIETPTAVNFAPDGTLYVTENSTGNLYAVDIATGEKRIAATSPTNPDNLAVTRSGDIYITHMSDNGVSKVDLVSGTSTPLTMSRLAIPADIVVLDDDLWVADTFALRRIAIDSGEITDIERVVGKHEYPFGIGVAGGNIVTTSWFSGSVQVYDSATGKSVRVLHGFSAPYDVADAGDESFYVAEFATGCVTHVSAEDERTCLIGDLAGPSSLAVDANGVLYISENIAGQITRYNPATGERKVIATSLQGVEGLALDGDRLVFAEASAARVMGLSLVDKSFEMIGELPLAIPGIDGFPSSFILSGVAASDGKVFATSDVDNAIYAFEK